jgi:hypothetical protein
VPTPRVEILGIRHHGPGSARSVLAALGELQPDLLLIEGPPELDATTPWAGDPGLVPPVAALVYATDRPRRALFYPVAAFSPEWVALRWALAAGVTVRYADLAATHVLAGGGPGRSADPPARGEPDAAGAEPEGAGPEPEGGAEAEALSPPPRPDAIGLLAHAAGYDDAERWWEDAVEHRPDSTLARFAAIRDAMAAVRQDAGDWVDAEENERREAAMRTAVRAGLRSGAQRVGFVCGAFHAPALDPAAYTATHDRRLLTGLPRTRVAATWVPWTSGRLAAASGYGAGVSSPGWYHHLFTTWQDEGQQAVVPSFLVRAARALREERLDAAPAAVVDAVRLAETLATVRGRPAAGLAEVTDAARAVLCGGSDLPLRLVERRLVVGESLGRVPDQAPVVPLAADLARQQRAVRLRPSAEPVVLELDLRRDRPRARSVLLHRLRVLGVDWGEPVEASRSTGTFKEAWELTWRPELSVALIEAGVHGTTVHAAAESRVRERAAQAADLATLARLAEQCLLADLPGCLPSVVAALADHTARQHDTRSLLGAVEPLARTHRYGDVRGADTGGLAGLVETIVVRASIGLRGACASLDDDAAGAMRRAVEAAQAGIALLDRPALWAPWRRALGSLGVDDHVHGAVSGRVNRLLLDAGLVPASEAATRMSRRMSAPDGAAGAAAWLDGFLAGEALVLLHDQDLLAVVDTWVCGIAEDTFEDLLPVLRRTFARFPPAERRRIGQHLRRGTGGNRHHAGTRLDLARGLPAMRTVARLLGLDVTDPDLPQGPSEVTG